MKKQTVIVCALVAAFAAAVRRQRGDTPLRGA